MLNNLAKVKANIRKIAKKYDLNFVVLFGSRVSGLVHKRSDIDLAYSAKKFLDNRKEYELIGEFQRAFNLGSKVEIELVNLDNAPPLLAKGIAFKGNLLTEITPHSFAYFQMYAFKLFVEAKPLFALRDKFISQNL
ncbi:nucleotidyltransferase domain-containing protein [Patescibacteria group bacterium]|nr:nucleotidyltransferase domain-containing protein [Patescibacteria group bacterium]